MGTIALKSDLHKILDRIENEELLQTIYDFLKLRENAKGGQIWESLTENQKKEVDLSYDESQDDNNLVDWEAVKKKY
ncbi:MAG: hypothetical protein PSV36_19300 [Algoriphagus sp.]|nr:hypothetical protein [Algoriphagus sp.]